MKIYLNKINENWIVDRFRKEWLKSNKNISTKFISNASIVWIISPWTWKEVNSNKLKDKKIVCSVHHLDFNNFDHDEFYKLDKIVTYYHVISSRTYEELSNLTEKKIFLIPWWVNEKTWYEINDKAQLRKTKGFKESDFLVGSFQRDTEGKDLISPKLIKGPDIFLRIVKEKYKNNPNLIVVLSGKRRQYLIKQLKKASIPYRYFEMVDEKELNELYNLLDLYIVASRIEGGPQSIVECAISKTPIISSDVGIARDFLHHSSIFKVDPTNQEVERTIPNIEYAYEKVKKISTHLGMEKFKKMFKEVNES